VPTGLVGNVFNGGIVAVLAAMVGVFPTVGVRAVPPPWWVLCPPHGLGFRLTKDGAVSTAVWGLYLQGADAVPNAVLVAERKMG
jgi:hypothetical protein